MYAQIVKFNLKPESSRELFLKLTEEMIGWLKGQDGFVAYEVYEGPDGWLDRIVWNTEQHAKDGRNKFITTDVAKQMLTLVENDYSRFFGEVVLSY